mgnify:CR=1 FL=1|jgi:hypothetical protein
MLVGPVVDYSFNHYCKIFRSNAFGRANSSIPMVNMLDDHDLIGGVYGGCQARASANMQTVSGPMMTKRKGPRCSPSSGLVATLCVSFLHAVSGLTSSGF